MKEFVLILYLKSYAICKAKNALRLFTAIQIGYLLKKYLITLTAVCELDDTLYATTDQGYKTVFPVFMPSKITISAYPSIKKGKLDFNCAMW